MGGKHVNPDSNFQTRKCAKRHHSDDWISQLPDEVLVVVLSLLSLKEAARTSVLSTRWINLWKHTFCLDFEAESSLDKIAEHRELLISERCKYVRWVNSVIESHKGGSTLKDFRICFDLDKCAQEEITKWLEFAFTRQVERLGLEFLDRCAVKMPDIMYAFPEHLLLVNNLKSLKALCLIFVDVTDEAVHFFLRNCQFLEQLVVIGANKITNLEVCGSSLGLKHLEIGYCHCLESIKVSAPNLTTLDVSRVEGLLLENVPMLKEMHIFCDKLVPALFCCIQQLEILNLSLNILKREIEQCKLPQLPKLKKLVISYAEESHYTNGSLIVLTSFLRISPYVQEFVIKISDEFQTSDEENDMSSDEENEIEEENRQVKSMGFPHHHLKVFTFEGYVGRRIDVELVKFILENCAMIEKIIIDPRTDELAELFVTKSKTFYGLPSPRMLEEETARKKAKQELQGLVPQHIEFLIL